MIASWIGAQLVFIGFMCAATSNSAAPYLVVAGSALFLVGLVLDSNEKIRRELEQIRLQLEER